jgi:hypothetical protein
MSGSKFAEIPIFFMFLGMASPILHQSLVAAMRHEPPQGGFE